MRNIRTEHTCVYCGNEGFFLQERGIHVGIYCSNCGKWISWCSKNEQEYYIKKGLKVYQEGERPTKTSSRLEAKNNESKTNYRGVEDFFDTGCNVDIGKHNTTEKTENFVDLDTLASTYVATQEEHECEKHTYDSVNNKNMYMKLQTVNGELLQRLYTKEGKPIGDFKLPYCPICGKYS